MKSSFKKIEARLQKTESKIKKLTLTVVPYEEDEISWVSNSFLGTLNNGEISDLQVFAKSFTGKERNSNASRNHVLAMNATITQGEIACWQ